METKEHFILFFFKKSVNCTQQGPGDIKQHCAGKTHQKNAAAIAQRRKITFTKPVNDDNQIRAEVFTHKFYSSAQYFFPNC